MKSRTGMYPWTRSGSATRRVRRSPRGRGAAAVILMLTAGVGVATREAGAIPVYARRHNLGCVSCHLVPPKLNAFGEEFLARGYRLPPDQAGTVVDTLAISAWLSGRYEDQDSRFKKGYLNRIELIGGGPLGRGTSSYFVEWRPLSLETQGDGSLRDRSGRFEDAFVNLQAGQRGSVTIGQYRALRQVDVSRRLTVTEPTLFSTSLSGEPADDPRITSLRAFAPAGRSPGFTYQYQSVLRENASDGLFHLVTVPFVGELSLPLTSEAREEASFELRGPLKGVFLETFYRKGLNSVGAHAFLDDDRWLLQGVGTYHSGSLYLAAGLGVDERDSFLRERYSLEGEYIPARSENLRTALGLRIEHISKQGRDPAFIPYLALSSPNSKKHSFLLLVQYRAQQDNNALFVELGSLF